MSWWFFRCSDIIQFPWMLEQTTVDRWFPERCGQSSWVLLGWVGWLSREKVFV